MNLNTDVTKAINKNNFKTFYFSILLVNLIILFSLFLTPIESIHNFTVHNSNEVKFSFFSLFLFNYTHINLIHLFTNMFFFFFLFKQIATVSSVTKNEFIFIHTLGAIFIGSLVYSYLHLPFLEHFEQFHVGYSAIVFCFFGILWYHNMDISNKIFNLVFMVIVYGLIGYSMPEVKISHVGHISGFSLGILICLYNKKAIML